VVTRLRVAFRAGAATIHVRTRGDAELELWAAHRHAAPLAAVAGSDIEFRPLAGAATGAARVRRGGSGP
jgi:hypothetical protein